MKDSPDPQGKSHIRIGCFHESPEGRIAYAYGWDSTVLLRFDDDTGTHKVSEADFLASWKHRPDLSDFPDARDPRLSYEFDLFWDIKTRSQLVARLSYPDDETDPDFDTEVRAAMDRAGIVLTAGEQAVIDEARAVSPTP